MEFLKAQKGKQNLRLKDTCTFVIEKLRIIRTGSVKVGSVEAEINDCLRLFLVWKPEPPMVNILTTYQQ